MLCFTLAEIYYIAFVSVTSKLPSFCVL